MRLYPLAAAVALLSIAAAAQLNARPRTADKAAAAQPGNMSILDPEAGPILQNVVGAKSGYFGAAARGGMTWAETFLPGTDTQKPHAVQLYSLSTSGNYGGFFGSRSSDNRMFSQQNVIGMIALGVADHRNKAHRVWGGYSVAYQTQTGKEAVLIGHEVTTDNRSADAPPVTPASPNPAGLVNGLRMTCGDGQPAKHFRCSSAISVVFNGASYRTGLLFGDGSISKVSGYADAIVMPTDYGISWNAGGGAAEWRMFSNAGPLTYTNSIVLGTDTIDFYLKGGGTRPLRITPAGVVTSGTHQLAQTTFASLPACTADHAGTLAFINDAADAITTWNQKVTKGGSSNKAFVKCNGVSWNAF